MNTRLRIARLRKAGIALAILLLSACQFDPYTLSYAKTKPDPKDVVGHWIATEATLRDLADGPYKGARPMIEVLRDGSIRMNEIPDVWRAENGRGAGKVEAFIGKWQLQKVQDSWWGLDLRRGDWGCTGCLMVMGDTSPHKLVLRFGDPDEGQGYEFVKTG